MAFLAAFRCGLAATARSHSATGSPSLARSMFVPAWMRMPAAVAAAAVAVAPAPRLMSSASTSTNNGGKPEPRSAVIAPQSSQAPSMTARKQRMYVPQPAGKHKPFRQKGLQAKTAQSSSNSAAPSLQDNDRVVVPLQPRACAYSTADSYDFDRLLPLLHRVEFTLAPFAEEDEISSSEVIHIFLNNAAGERTGECFIFQVGSFVTWNATDKQIETVRGILEEVENQPYERSVVDDEYEDMRFDEDSDRTHVKNDLILFDKTATPHTHKLEKYSVSNGMALAVKLSMWEDMLSAQSEDIARVIEQLRSGKDFKMSADAALQINGELLYLRYRVNLIGDFLTVPVFYWNREELDTLYRSLVRVMDIPHRITVINRRLDHALEIAALCRNLTTEAKGTRLEVIIIVLIAVEVVFEMIHLVI